MKTFRIIAITFVLSGALFITGSAVYGALVFSTGAGTSSGGTTKPIVVQTQEQPVQTSSMNALYVQEQSAVAPTVSKQQYISAVPKSDQQRIADLEARVSALEARVK